MWVTNNNKERGFETEGRGSGCGQNGDCLDSGYIQWMSRLEKELADIVSLKSSGWRK